MIKKVACLVISFYLLLTQAIAQTSKNDFLSLNNPVVASAYYERYYKISPAIQHAIVQNRPGEKLRNTGLIILGFGGVLLISGIALVATSPVNSPSRSTAYINSSGPPSNDGFGFVLGVTAIGHGIAALIAGGILTNIGVRKMHINPTDISE